jgi:enoyl-CoA hydratase/carnithine racemase
MANEKIIPFVREGFAELQLNKPAKLNALDEDMLVEIEKWFSMWEAEASVSVVLLSSTADRAFSVGADIEVLSRHTTESMQSWELLGNRVLDKIQNSPLVSLAAISGYAFGGGLTLAAACDFRVASEDSMFGQPEIDLGWVPGWGGVARLARLVGVTRAKDLCMTGRRILAQYAELAGLIDRVSPKSELRNSAACFARELAGKHPEALRGIKALAATDSQVLAAHRFDALLNSSLLHNPKAQAAIAGFLDRSKR